MAGSRGTIPPRPRSRGTPRRLGDGCVTRRRAPATEVRVLLLTEGLVTTCAPVGSRRGGVVPAGAATTPTPLEPYGLIPTRPSPATRRCFSGCYGDLRPRQRHQ